MISDNKIQSSEVTRLHVQGADDVLSGSPADNKAIFDALPELIVQRYNSALDDISEAIDELNEEGAKVKCDTTAGWNSQIDLVAEEGVVYVYTDYLLNEDNEPIPAFKVGDGLAYLIDIPFNEDINSKHIQNTNIHITNDERECWNNKVTVYLDVNYLEELVFSKE